MDLKDDKLISLSNMEQVKKYIDSKAGVTYKLTKNEDNEIVLSCGDGNDTKVSDDNTTYTFVENDNILTITGSDGTINNITLNEYYYEDY